MASIPAASVILVLCLVPLTASAQGTKVDYQRSDNLRTLTSDKVFRDSVEPHWLEDGKFLWYRVRTGPRTHEWTLVDTANGERTPAFDHAKLAGALTKAGIDAAAASLPLEQVDVDLPAGCVVFQSRGKNWVWKTTDSVLAEGNELPARNNSSKRGRRSDADQTETAITFVNRTKVSVEIFWIPDGGDRQSYGKLAADAKRRQHTFVGHRWAVVDETGRELGTVVGVTPEREVGIPDDLVRPEAVRERRREARRRQTTSPDDKYRVVLRDHNLLLVDLADDSEHMLTTDGVEADHYEEEVFWSPDSRHCVALRTQPAEEHKVSFIESSPKDQVQPKLHTFDYLKPGDRVAISKPHLFQIPERREIALSDTLYRNPFALRDVRWDADSRRFTFLFNERGHQTLRVLAVDADSGTTVPIIEERSPTFIDYAGKMYRHDLPATRELIWMSERDGWNHLYLFDRQTGDLKNQITRGEWVVRSVERIDEDQRQIWFTAGGIRPGQSPYYVHYCRVNFDGTGLIVLTEGDGQHRAEFSPDRRCFVDTWSRVDQPPVTELRRSSDGSLIATLERADWQSLLETGWKVPERFVAKGRDGVTDIHGIIWRPTNHDPAKKYPVIENIYAGPHSAFVPQGFRSYYPQQGIAELGFIVVQIDGMGTSQRSKAFHDVCWKNIGDSGFPDRIAWIKAAAAMDPSFDLTRVGIYGGSAGGQNSTRALLAHGDFYKVAVSDCGCHDNRMDKIWWNELWMGWPVGDHYAEQSNVTQAHHLTGKLLLVVGEMDRNVDPASTMQVANALIKADRDFDLLIIPGAGHGACETPYGQRRRKDFFVRHLLHTEPRRVL